MEQHDWYNRPDAMPAPDTVLDLARRFERNLPDYRAGGYKEEQLRIEFLNPLFAALGWDVDNRKGYAEAYKDVVHEDALKIGAAMKAPDYSFRIGGARKFFVEAKKPSVYIKADVAPAYQLRRYAWSAKLPLSILTDFEEFAVYDTRIKPAKNDPASRARITYIKYTEYAERWDEIASVFSREAVLMGSFDRYAQSNRNRRGTEEVDDAFLEEIERWRELLAKNIALRNPGLTQRELNFAVQRTIDRIVFLRIGEDRGLEPYQKLSSLAGGKHVYAQLLQDFRAADDRYNSGLFHFTKERGRSGYPDELTPKLEIDDRPLKDIIRHLYYPDSPYEFAVLPSDILGQVYERFLGKVIELDARHRATVVEKPEVRKAGGVYYTPTYVVDYIVRETVGRLVEGKKPEQVQMLRVLDPACGSGSFLLGAYQFLLDWHLSYYTNGDGTSPGDPESFARKRPPRLYRDVKGEWRLTPQERRRILLDNIYGADIDRQAVEVTKLSLLLKVLEGESAQSLATQLKMFHERALPDLGSNIKCGNSLIGHEFYDGRPIELFSEEDRYHINAFDWSREFPEIMQRGGFDAVIGNPPYIPIESITTEERAYITTSFPQLERKYDSSVVFILAMLRRLARRGRIGFISSVTWQTGVNYNKLRGHIFNEAGLELLINLPFDVFSNAYVDTGIYILTAGHAPEYRVYNFPKGEKSPDLANIPFITVPTRLSVAPEYKVVLNPLAQDVLLRASDQDRFSQLGDFTISTQGLSASRFNLCDHANGASSYPFLARGQVYRYQLVYEDMKFTTLDDKPSLKPFYDAAPKVLIRRVISRQDRLLATLTSERLVFKKDINPFVITAPEWDAAYVLGVINSSLISYLYVNSSSIATKDDFRQTTLTELRQLPIPRPTAGNVRDRGMKDQVAQLGLQLLGLQKRISQARTGHDRRLLERQAAATDKRIDQLVYELYGLSEEEITIVEG